MIVKIVNWEKYNPRSDYKTSWLRIDNNIYYSKTMYSLTVKQKWFWVFLLCKYSENDADPLHIDEKYFSHCSGLKIDEILNALKIYKEKQLIEVLSIGTDRNRSDSNGSVLTNERTNERTYIVQIENLYKKHYLRKEGKTQGIKKLAKQIKSDKDLGLLEKAMIKYSEEIKSDKREKRFIKMFSSFASCWQDYAEEKELTYHEKEMKKIQDRVDGKIID